jgi:hypothetical protein
LLISETDAGFTLTFSWDKDILVHMIPSFDKRGYLPPGKPYKATWEEFVERFAATEHRRFLLDGLERALKNLKQAGCHTVYVDGSFITDKERPGDWDACWELDGVNVDLVDEVILDADRILDRMKAKYLGDLFLQAPRLPGGNFLNRFQTDRDGLKKGIIVIDLRMFP